MKSLSSGLAIFLVGESSVIGSYNSLNVAIVLKLPFSVFVNSSFPGRTLIAVVNPASNAALASVKTKK